MPKEAVIAIIIGFAFGLLITFGVYTANRSLKEKAGTSPNPSINDSSPLPTSTPEPGNLTIDLPENESLVDQAEIELKGRANPDAVIAILTENNELLLTADKDGSFSANITLIKGLNSLKITSVDKDNQKIEKNLTVVYSTAAIE